MTQDNANQLTVAEDQASDQSPAAQVNPASDATTETQVTEPAMEEAEEEFAEV